MITVKLVIGFLCLFLLTKLLGKTELSKITPFDFVSALVMGELLGNALYEEHVKWIEIVYAFALWGILMYFMELMGQKFLPLRGFLEGNPSIVIRNGMMDREQLKKNNMNINQLLNKLRQSKVFSVREVAYAILETNGQLSVMKKSEFDAPTKSDLQIPPQKNDLPVTLVSDGQILHDNLKAIGYDEQWLVTQLLSFNMYRLKLRYRNVTASTSVPVKWLITNRYLAMEKRLGETGIQS